MCWAHQEKCPILGEEVQTVLNRQGAKAQSWRKEMLSVFLCGEGEIEGCSFVDGGFGPDATAVFGDDAFDDGEADADTFKFVGFVETLEHAE